MLKFLHITAVVGLALSILLIYLDNYFSPLSLYILGLVYLLIGWNEHKAKSKSYKFYLIVGLLITVITFLGEFISGYILFKANNF